MKNEEWLRKPGFILIVVAICMVCIGCKPGVPGDVSQPDEMEDIKKKKK